MPRGRSRRRPAPRGVWGVAWRSAPLHHHLRDVDDGQDDEDDDEQLDHAVILPPGRTPTPRPLLRVGRATQPAAPTGPSRQGRKARASGVGVPRWRRPRSSRVGGTEGNLWEAQRGRLGSHRLRFLVAPLGCAGPGGAADLSRAPDTAPTAPPPPVVTVELMALAVPALRLTSEVARIRPRGLFLFGHHPFTRLIVLLVVIAVVALIARRRS